MTVSWGRGGSVEGGSWFLPRLPKDGWGRAGQKVLPWSDLLIRVVEPWDLVVSAGLWTHFVATLDKVQYNYCMHAAQAYLLLFCIFLCVKRISSKSYPRINESSFRVRVIYDFSYFVLIVVKIKLIILSYIHKLPCK